MPRADLCPECQGSIHPFAATCAACGADLDAHRRRRLAAAQQPSWLAVLRQRPSVGAPGLSRDLIDLVVGTLLLVLLALFAPLFGLLFSLLVVWHANRHGPLTRRNLAILCAALAAFNLVDPSALLGRLPI